MTAVKVIRIMGTSEESWEDAAHEAYEQADQSVEDISGMKVLSWTANTNDTGIEEYKATVELSFPVHEQQG
jgi:flavin-binding protein dodecin